MEEAEEGYIQAKTKQKLIEEDTKSLIPAADKKAQKS